MDTHHSPLLALIAGPTASGKSDCAVRLALMLKARGKNAIIINADSAQVYADLPILSAQPDRVVRQGIVHRLFGAWDGAQSCSAADWATRAKTEIAEAHAIGAVPIVVGGTGLYIRTLLDGIAPVPVIDPVVRKAVRAMDVAEAHAALASEDPAAAARLHPADKSRIARALEVIRSSDRPLAEWQAKKQGGIGDRVALCPLILLPDRATLYQRCDARFTAMLAVGAIDEVAQLLARRLDPDLPVMRAIGVTAIAGFLRGEYDPAEAERIGAQATRNYAKRQYTWLRHQLPDAWLRYDAAGDAVIAAMVSRLS